MMKSKMKLIGAMLIFGSVGLFVRKINLPSNGIALLRGIIGSIFLIGVCYVTKQRISLRVIRKNLLILILSGGAIGLNWIMLFEAYNYTTISKATLSYYFAPIFVIILSPIVLKEKLTFRRIIGVLAAMLGLFLVVDIRNSEHILSHKQLIGISYGLAAAGLYASVTLMNKFLKGLSGLEITLAQLLMAVLVLGPYVFLKEGFTLHLLDASSVLSIMILGIVHTGVAYYMYFSAMQNLKAQSIAIYSYIDPISAIILSAIFLGESMTWLQIIGGVFILGSAAFAKDS